MGKNYWMMVASPEDYEITKKHGFTVYGVRGKYRRRAQRMQPEDRILFYVKGLRKWTATATITSQFFEDRTPIWNVDGRTEVYPFRVKTKPEIVLGEEDYIDALLLAPRLDYVKRWAPEDWPLAFFESLHLLPQKDFRLIEAEMNRFVTPRRNGRNRQAPRESDIGRGRNRVWEQDRRRPNSSNSDWRNGPTSPAPSQEAPQTPPAEAVDEQEATPRANPVWQPVPQSSVDEHDAPVTEDTAPSPVDERVSRGDEAAPSSQVDERDTWAVHDRQQPSEDERGARAESERPQSPLDSHDNRDTEATPRFQADERDSLATEDNPPSHEDEHENEATEAAPQSSVDEHENSATESAPERPVNDRDYGQPLAQRAAESPEETLVNDSAARNVGGYSRIPSAPEDSVDDDQPATDDSSTDSSSTT